MGFRVSEPSIGRGKIHTSSRSGALIAEREFIPKQSHADVAREGESGIPSSTGSSKEEASLGFNE